MGDVAVATIVAKNYISFARVLADSLRRHHPELPFFVLLTDEVDGYFAPENEPFSLVQMSELTISDPARFRRHYSRKQVAAAAKPYLLEHVLERGFGGAIFLDPDTLVLSDLSEVLALVRRRGIVLTPHLLRPPTGQAAVARELNILQSGVYNAGFIGVTDTPGTRRFLAWWQSRVYANCRHEVAAGLYYDQRWLDLVPVFFDDVSILRDPTCNVAHWNLPERAVRLDDETFMVDGRPCRFFHFSGFDPDYPDLVTRYSPRLGAADLGATALLLQRYAELLVRAGYHETKAWPYAYDNIAQSIAGRIWRNLGNLGKSSKLSRSRRRTAAKR
ncbi:MAG: hypothetical protein HY899_01425 [Deltaproteobacteria bacterium]|nr:hypothetical protein [Deltaproteobacteria bacterium]